MTCSRPEITNGVVELMSQFVARRRLFQTRGKECELAYGCTISGKPFHWLNCSPSWGLQLRKFKALRF
jgi:hypothetical protein